MKRSYWSFYWPLAITGTTVLLANQFQNGALARYPDASRELAVFAYAFSIFALSRAALAFVPQMANLLARSRRAHRVCLGFIVGAGLVLMAPLLFMGLTSPGAAAISRIFGIEGRTLADVSLYVTWLAPLVLVHGLRQYSMGLLIQKQSTRLVTVLNLSHLTMMLLSLVVGFRSGWSPVATLVIAQWSADALHLALLAAAVLRTYELPELEHEDLSFAGAFGFFWPVAVTSMMFAVSRPVLYGFASRGPNAVATVAALRVAFDFALFFHQPLNQFRHLFATFGTENLKRLRRFQFKVVSAVTAAMLVVSFSSIDTWLFSRLLGIEGEVLRFAEESFRALSLLPAVVGFRNYFHGLALARLTTEGMAYGALLRVGAIYLVAWAAFSLGWLDHESAAAILVLGFAVEAVVVLAFLRRRSPSKKAPAAGLDADFAE